MIINLSQMGYQILRMKLINALLFFVMIAFSVYVPPARAVERTLGIAAVVNDEAISMADVEERMRLVIISSGLPSNPEIRARIMPQVLDSLIEEQLKLQEAARHNLVVSEEELKEGFSIIAKQNNFTADQFREVMAQQKIPVKTLERQIRAQLAWNKVIKEVLRRKVNVTENDVDQRLARLKANIGKTEYLTSEIFLPLETGKRAAEQQQFVARMVAELQAKKAPFGPVAAQFSKAAGAEKGGDIGWVQQGHLEPDLEQALFALEEGGVSNPIRTQNGIYILHLRQKRTLTDDTLPSRDDLTNQIGFERLDRVQQRALLDLKSAGFIDRRV